MNYNEKNIRGFMYDSDRDTKCKKTSSISAECWVCINNDQCENLYSKFANCIKNDTTDDIVEIVKKIRDVFDMLEETKLKVRIKKGKYIQEVEYFEGVMYNCCFSITDLDDVVYVSRNYRGVDIQYKRKGNLVPSEIYDEIGAFLLKINDLSNLEYEKVSVKKKKKVK